MDVEVCISHTVTLESNLHMLSVDLPAGSFLAAAGETRLYEIIDQTASYVFPTGTLVTFIFFWLILRISG